jgi:hypothetical protein
MKVVTLGIADLPKGSIVELKGKDLANVRFVRSKLSEKARKDGEDPLTYHHFSVAGRGFTIDSNDEESAEMLKDAAKRKSIAILTLEATEHLVEETDDNGDGMGTFITRKSFRFISVLSLEDFNAYAATEGQVLLTEAKYAPKESTAPQAAIDKAVSKGFQALMAQLKNEPVALPNPPAPVAEEVAQ